jgi:hypothetical protein
MMQANIDKGFVELLNERTGLNLTWKQFTAIYRERKAQRDADPVIQARRARNRQLNELMETIAWQEFEQELRNSKARKRDAG